MDNHVPELRFPNFSLSWENKKLGDLGCFKGGGTPNSDKDIYWKGNFPWISSSDIIDGNIHNIKISRSITDEAIKNSATKIIPPKSVLFVSRVGVGKLAVSTKEICTSQDFTNFTPTNSNPFYLGYLFQSKNNLLKRYSQGTSIKGFTSKDLKNIKILVTEVKEQQKIADFLSSVDNKISLLIEKQNLLQRYKKGVMQKLFSQELRFKDDKGNDFPDWEEKKFGDLGTFLGGGTPSTDEKEYWSGYIPWVSSSDTTENSIHKINYTRHITDKAIKDSATKLVPANSLLLVSRVGVGKMAVTLCEVCTSQDFTNFTPLENDVFFIAYYLSFHKKKLFSFSQGTSIKGFTIKDIKVLKLNMPSLVEQQKIAKFLNEIDKKIDSATQQIEQTKTFKKGLLQKMFV